MDTSNFVGPLETVQFISVLSYLNSLSKFLFIENLLDETDLNKPIPAVNAMYKYLVGSNTGNSDATDEARLEKLVKYLIKSSDLYGSEEEETLDAHFIQSLFNHIINSLVFSQYGNVYGFLAEVIRTSNSTTVEETRGNVLQRLSDETFQNEYGPDSKLDQLSLRKIFEDFILPLFPKAENDISIFSIDYIYAQAGAMFFRSISNGSVNSITYNEAIHQIFNANEHFDEYIRIAHIVEQLVTTQKIDISAYRIFAIPALFHYVHENKEGLRNRTMADIINDPNQWQAAFGQLFLKMSAFFETVDAVKDKNYNYYSFLRALGNYKNQSSLTRENIKKECPSLSKEALEEEVEKYIKCTEDCSCNNETKKINLTSVDTLFKQQFNSIVENYAVYEYESLKSVFPYEIKTLMGKHNVEIWRGFIRNLYVDTGPGFNARESQAVPEQHDILEFYYPETKHSSYYALLRENYNVTLITKTDDALFTEKFNLGPYDSLLHWKFPTLLKSVDGNFTDFLRNITKERVKIFRRGLEHYKNEKLEQPWWKEFLLSLVPFYTCATAVKEQDLDLTEMACLNDVFFFIPFAADLSIALKELTAGTSRALQKVSLFGIKAATARLSLRTIARSGSQMLLEEGMKFTQLITPQLFKKVGIAALRFVDPGFEFVYLLGKVNFNLIGELINLMENAYPSSFSLMKEIMKNSKNGVTYTLEKIGQRYNFGANRLSKDVFVRSLGAESNAGYGYKFVYLPKGEIAELRSVSEFSEKVPVVFRNRIGVYKKVYKVDPKTGEIEIANLHLLHDTEFPEFRFKNVHDEQPCTVGKTLRSPDEKTLCFRTNLLKEKNEREEEAAKVATMVNTVSKEQIKNELRNYLFLEGDIKTEIDFVKKWRDNNFLEKPNWSEEYKIDLPEVFHELRYENSLNELNPITSNMRRAEKNYRRYRAYKYVSLEDFEYIGYYVGLDYDKITENSELGRGMRKALYRLAIRQSDDPLKEYNKILYRGETRPEKNIDRQFYPGKQIKFDKFTSTSKSKEVSLIFSSTNLVGEAQVMYEMEFPETYLRAKVEKMEVFSFEEETVLLPGSKFVIDDVAKHINERGTGTLTVTVKMSYIPTSKLEDIKNVMKELKKLKELDA